MIGFLALLPLAVTSNNLRSGRLGPVAWKRLHRLTYVAAVAGAVHYLMLVKAWPLEPILYAAAIAVLLALRLWWARGSSRDAPCLSLAAAQFPFVPSIRLVAKIASAPRFGCLFLRHQKNVMRSVFFLLRRQAVIRKYPLTEAAKVVTEADGRLDEVRTEGRAEIRGGFVGCTKQVWWIRFNFVSRSLKLL